MDGVYIKPKYFIKSWWPKNNRYYVLRISYYQNWLKDDGSPMPASYGLHWWGTWQECVDRLRRQGW